MKKHIPNLVTCLNVMSGSMAVLMALYGRIECAAGFILLGMVFDFFDGLLARLLHVKSDLGKELDSLADVVSFGIAPAVIVHLLMRELLAPEGFTAMEDLSLVQQLSLFVPVLIPAFSAYRLAKFNLDSRQSTSFIGLPVPAHALFWVCLVFARVYAPEYYLAFFGNVWVLAVCVLILSILLISELPMFSLKISGFGWKANRLRYTYLALLIFIALFFGWVVLLFVIPLYILFCVLGALNLKKQTN